MPDAATRRAYWCDLFAKLYSAREGCDRKHAMVAAQMLYPSMRLLTPTQALLMLCADPALSDAIRDEARRANGEP